MKPIRSKNSLSRQNIQGTISVVDKLRPQDIYEIDGIAARAWLLMDGQKTTDDITTILTSEAKEERALILDELDKFLSDLNQFKLVEYV